MSKLRQATFGLVLMTLVSTMVLPAEILLWPQKTEAQGSCIAGIISSLFGKLGGMLGGIGGGEVPTKDSATRGNTQKTSGYTGGSFVSDCIIKPLVKNLVKQLIHSFLTSITDWINDGFDGSGPRFVSDPASFFAEIADRAAGQVIYGTDLGFLCSPFRANIQLSLGLHYLGGGGFRERIGCTLSDIQQNFQNAFMGGQWDPNGDGGGWQNWINLTTIPQNNPYGAFLIAQDEINIRIANQQFVAGKEADWGAGFLTTKRCVEYITGKEELAMLDAYGGDPCLRYETVTPGVTIKEGLSKSLGSSIDQYVAAEDLDAIFGALMNQMIGGVFKATGLFSGGRSNPNYYQNQFRQQIADGTFNVYKQPTSDNGALELVSCNDPSDSHYIQNYTLSANDTAVMFFNKSLTTPAWEDITNKSNPFLVNRTQTRVIDYQQAQNYCAKNPSWNAAQATIDNLENSIATQSSNQCSQQSKLYSGDILSTDASAFENSSPGGGADKAVDGSSDTYAKIYKLEKRKAWLEIILKKQEMLTSIQIQTYDSSFPLDTNSKINLYDTAGSPTPLSISQVINSATANFIFNSTPPAKIQKIRIEQQSNFWLLVSEVTFNRYISPVVNWSGVSSAKINKPFDVLKEVTAKNCNTDRAITGANLSFIINPLSYTQNVNEVTFTTTGTYTVTYKANDGVADASFTRTIVVGN